MNPVQRVVFTRGRLPELHSTQHVRGAKGICLIVSDGPDATQFVAWLSQVWPRIEHAYREEVAGFVEPIPPGKKELQALRMALEDAIREVDSQLTSR